MDDSLNICLACGLCCDGTLIGYVKLDSDEMPALKEVMEIEEEDGIGFFLHPCKKYCDGCTIYSQRPKNCDYFKCGLLKSVEKKELGFDTAVEAVQLVKQKKFFIENQLVELNLELQSGSFYFKMVELKKLLEKKKEDDSLNQSQLKLMEELEDLNSLLVEKFDLTLE